MKENKPYGQRIFLKIIIFLFIVFMGTLIFIKICHDNDPNKILQDQKNTLFSTIDKTINVNVTKYTTYGTHFNLEGTLSIIKISGIEINYVDLILKNSNGEETRCKSRF